MCAPQGAGRLRPHLRHGQADSAGDGDAGADAVNQLVEDMRRVSGAIALGGDIDCVICHVYKAAEQMYRNPDRGWVHVSCEERELLWKTHTGL